MIDKVSEKAVGNAQLLLIAVTHAAASVAEGCHLRAIYLIATN